MTFRSARLLALARQERTAPLARNTDMAQAADALVLLWDGQSTGSLDMLRKAEARGLAVYGYTYQDGRLRRGIERRVAV